MRLRAFLRLAAASLVLVPCIATIACGALAPVSGNIHVTASTFSISGGSHTHTPPDVSIGPSYGTTSHQAQSTSGAATARITHSVTFQPESIVIEMSGFARPVLANNNASAGGFSDAVFTLDAAATIRVSVVGDGSNAALGTTVRDSQGQPLFFHSFQFGSAQPPQFHDLPAGQYSMRTDDVIMRDSSVMLAQVTQTIQIVPEPSAPLAALLAATTATALWRGRQARVSIVCDSSEPALRNNA